MLTKTQCRTKKRKTSKHKKRKPAPTPAEVFLKKLPRNCKEDIKTGFITEPDLYIHTSKITGATRILFNKGACEKFKDRLALGRKLKLLYDTRKKELIFLFVPQEGLKSGATGIWKIRAEDSYKKDCKPMLRIATKYFHDAFPFSVRWMKRKPVDDLRFGYFIKDADIFEEVGKRSRTVMLNGFTVDMTSGTYADRDEFKKYTSEAALK